MHPLHNIPIVCHVNPNPNVRSVGKLWSGGVNYISVYVYDLVYILYGSVCAHIF